jgi:hypothetical protein
MSRRVAVLLLTGALVAAMMVAGAGAALADNGDLAAGSGQIGQFGEPRVNVSAKETTNGYQGQFNIRYPNGTYVKGDVTCLYVQGNQAYIIGQIDKTEGSTSFAEGQYIVIGIQDNGEPSSVPPDMLNFSPGMNTEPACGPNGAATPVIPIVSGNFEVKDVE